MDEKGWTALAPDLADYAVVKGEDMSAGVIFLEVGKGGQFRNVLVEDCLLRYAMVNFISYAKEGRDPDTPVANMVIRRSLIMDMYTPIGLGHNIHLRVGHGLVHGQRQGYGV